MILMGFGTVLNELERNDLYSQIIIVVLLLGIYGLITINETNINHYCFAFVVFIAILLFMFRQCYLHEILLSSLYLEIFTLIFIIANINGNIFYGEILYIVNFAFYYLYLHFIQKIDVDDTIKID